MSEETGALAGLYAQIREHERRLNERDADWREFRTWRDKINADMAELLPAVRRIERELREDRERRSRLAETAERQRKDDEERADREQREAERTKWSRLLPWIMAAGSGSGLVASLYHFLTSKGH